MTGDSKQIIALQDRQQRTTPGKIGANGLNALLAVEELVLEQGPETALAQLMVETSAHLLQRPKRNPVMHLPVGPILEIGLNAHFLVAALELRLGRRHALSQRMVDNRALPKKHKKKLRAVTCQLAGPILETGQSVHYLVEELVLKLGQSLALNPRMGVFHAPNRK